MTDRELMQQALDALENSVDRVLEDAYQAEKFYGNYPTRQGKVNGLKVLADDHEKAIAALRNRLAHCDRCGKRLGGEGDIHTCSPDPIGDAQDRLIAEMAAQPEQKWQYGTPLLNLFTKQPEQEPVAEVVWGSKTDFEWKFKMLVELACVEDVPVKLYAGPFKGAAMYWHDTETDKGTTPPAAASMTEFEEAVAAVDNTLHHAIDHWQDRALKAEALLAQPEQEPAAWLCGRSNGDTFALTVKQLRELGYGNISMPPFKKLAPLFTALAQQEMAHDRMMDDALTIGSAWVRDGKRLEPTSVYKSMEEDA